MPCLCSLVVFLSFLATIIILFPQTLNPLDWQKGTTSRHQILLYWVFSCPSSQHCWHLYFHFLFVIYFPHAGCWLFCREMSFAFVVSLFNEQRFDVFPHKSPHTLLFSHSELNRKVKSLKNCKAKIELLGSYDPQKQLIIKDPYYVSITVESERLPAQLWCFLCGDVLIISRGSELTWIGFMVHIQSQMMTPKG